MIQPKMKVFLACVAIALALGVGYVASQLINNDKAQTSNGTVTNSSSESSGTTVDLSGQQLSALPESVLAQTNITTLNLSNNQLTTLPTNISNLTNLVELNIENNRLESLPDELSNMVWLKHLDISNNRLSQSQIEQIKTKLTNTEVKS